MADEYRQLIVSADQIDSAVQWVEANKVNVIKKIETLDAEVLQLSEDVLLIKGLDLQHMQTDINELKTNLETVDAEVLQLTEDVLLIKGLDLQHMKSDIEDLQINTYTKTETDAKITEKLSALVAGAPERFDTLKELADWIDSHADSAAAMNSAIEKNAADITTANAAIEKNAEDVATANTNITKNAEDIANKLDNTTKYALSDSVGGAALSVKTVVASANGEKLVLFSGLTTVGNANACVDEDYTYNPLTNTLTVPNIKSGTTAALKNDVAINKSTLGTQCKNLLPYRCLPHSNSNGIKVDVADDGVVTLSGTTTKSFTYHIDFKTPLVFDKDVFIVGAEKISNMLYNCKVDKRENGNLYPAISTNGLLIPAGTSIEYLYFQQNTTGKEIEATIAPMIVYADVLDRTYEPYVPSLQEQLNSLIARIETLETAATTTEGGE